MYVVSSLRTVESWVPPFEMCPTEFVMPVQFGLTIKCIMLIITDFITGTPRIHLKTLFIIEALKHMMTSRVFHQLTKHTHRPNPV